MENTVFRFYQQRCLGPADKEDLKKAQPVFHLSADPKKGRIGILCLHGFNALPDSFFPVTQYFLKLGYSVACPQLLGFGTKPEDLINIQWQQWLQSVEKAYFDLLNHCVSVYIIAQSMGANFALQLACQDKENKIKKIYLFNPAILSPHKLNLAPWFRFIFQKFHLNYFPIRGGDIKAANAYELAYKKVSIDAIYQLYRCMLATKTILAKIDTPIWIFNSRHDHVVNWRDGNKILEEIKTSPQNKKLFLLNNSYHVLSLDNDLDKVLNQINKDIIQYSVSKEFAPINL